eukprot:5470043-Alexandrium_andersonii.AAC.1
MPLCRTRCDSPCARARVRCVRRAPNGTRPAKTTQSATCLPDFADSGRGKGAVKPRSTKPLGPLASA